MKKMLNKKNISWTIFAAALFTIIQILISTKVIGYFHQITLFTVCINILLALGLNLIVGFSGQFSLGHAGFMAVGAYSAAIMLVKIPNYLGLLLGILLGIIITTIVALVIAIPTFRLRGDYLAIATLGFSEIIRIAVLNMKITNGAAGMSNIPVLTKWPIMFIAILLAIVIIVNFAKSSHGRATASVREDEIASESVGINTTKYKTISFIIGAGIASVAGALYASYFSIIAPEAFNVQMSIDILVIVVFGGMGSLSGSVVAAIVLGLINMALQSYSSIRNILYAAAIIAIMVFRPKGLFGNKEIDITKVKDIPSIIKTKIINIKKKFSKKEVS
ncbi:MAG: branched-chain amino acid ABC transporter permease [Erysipelotrichaceae bacterium]